MFLVFLFLQTNNNLQANDNQSNSDFINLGLLIVAVVAVLVTGFGIFIAYLQKKEAKRQADEAKKEANAAIRSLKKEVNLTDAEFINSFADLLRGMAAYFKERLIPYDEGNSFKIAVNKFPEKIAKYLKQNEKDIMEKLKEIVKKADSADEKLKNLSTEDISDEELARLVVELKRVAGRLKAYAENLKVKRTRS